MSESAQTSNADVFVSYSSYNRDNALKIVNQLKSAGVSVWIDIDKIDGAARWSAEIVAAIEACKIVLLMCSDASMRSWAVTQEIQLAGENQKRLLPLLLEPSNFPAQMKFFLAGVQWIDIFSDPPDIWMPRIIRALKRAGINCDETGRTEPEGESIFQPNKLDWSLAGLQSLARFTDQLWVFSADRPVLDADRLLIRGLGEAQSGAQHSFQLGSRIQIGIESDRDGHLLLLDEGPEGKLFCLCPSHFARSTRLPKGTNILPHSRSSYDNFVLTGIPGREQLLAIVSEDVIGLDWMPSDPVQPARVLDDRDVNDLLAKLQTRPKGSWTALATYFDVVSDR